MPLFEHLRKVDVRAVLRSLKCGGSVTFQLRPREFINGRWQGGTFLSAKRLTRRFLIGGLTPMTMKEAVEYVHAAFDGYHTPASWRTNVIPPSILYAGAVMSHSGPLTDSDKTRMLNIANNNRRKPPVPVATGGGDNEDWMLVAALVLLAVFVGTIGAVVFAH